MPNLSTRKGLMIWNLSLYQTDYILNKQPKEMPNILRLMANRNNFPRAHWIVIQANDTGRKRIMRERWTVLKTNMGWTPPTQPKQPYLLAWNLKFGYQLMNKLDTSQHCITSCSQMLPFPHQVSIFSPKKRFFHIVRQQTVFIPTQIIKNLKQSTFH